MLVLKFSVHKVKKDMVVCNLMNLESKSQFQIGVGY